MTDLVAQARTLLERKLVDAADAAAMHAIASSQTPTANQLRILANIVGRYDLPDAPQQEISARSVPAPTVEKKWVETTVHLTGVTTKYGDLVAIMAPYDKEALGIIRSIEGRSFDKTGEKSGRKNAWLIPVAQAEAAAAKLRALEPRMKVEVDLFVGTLIERYKAAYQESRASSADVEVPTKLPLRPFQKAGVKWVVDRGGRALIADDPGLGKTPQALGYLALSKKLPALIVCPANLRPNWYQEVLRFTDLKPLIVTGVTSLPGYQKLGFESATEPKAGYDVTITNYDLFETETPKTWIKRLMKGEDEDAGENLIAAGHQAMKLLEQAMKKASLIEQRNRLNRAILGINDLGRKARSIRQPPYRKVVINGKPASDFLSAGAWRALVMDECHAVKDPKAQRAMATEEIAESMESVVGLTGTPVMNRVSDVYMQVRIINKTIFPTFFDFGLRYCNGHKKAVPIRRDQRESDDEVTREVWDFSGSSNLPELEEKLRSTVMIRREKRQVLTELPPKTRVLVPFVIDDPAVERKMKKEMRAPLEELAKLRADREAWKKKLEGMSPDERKSYAAGHAGQAIAASRIKDEFINQISLVQKACAMAKMDQTVEFVLDRIEGVGKMLVFASHHDVLDALHERLGETLKVERIDGRIAMAKRPPIIERFQKGDTQILVCGIAAVSEGLTLTASYTSLFTELMWNPSRMLQAEDRIYRIGQSMPVTIYYLIMLGSIEEKIARMIDGKMELVNSVLGEESKNFEEDGIMDAVLSEI